MNEEDKKNWAPYVKEKTQQVLLAVQAQLKDDAFILGEFSSVDVCLGYALDMVSEESFFSDYPVVKSYYERLSGRDACQKSEIFKKS